MLSKIIEAVSSAPAPSHAPCLWCGVLLSGAVVHVRYHAISFVGTQEAPKPSRANERHYEAFCSRTCAGQWWHAREQTEHEAAKPLKHPGRMFPFSDLKSPAALDMVECKTCAMHNDAHDNATCECIACNDDCEHKETVAFMCSHDPEHQPLSGLFDRNLAFIIELQEQPDPTFYPVDAEMFGCPCEMIAAFAEPPAKTEEPRWFNSDLPLRQLHAAFVERSRAADAARESAVPAEVAQ